MSCYLRDKGWFCLQKILSKEQLFRANILKEVYNKENAKIIQDIKNLRQIQDGTQ